MLNPFWSHKRFCPSVKMFSCEVLKKKPKDDDQSAQGCSWQSFFTGVNTESGEKSRHQSVCEQSSGRSSRRGEGSSEASQRLRSAASAVRVGAGRKSAAAPHLLLPLLPLLLQLLLSLAQLLQLLLDGRPVALARNAQRLRDETRKT